MRYGQIAATWTGSGREDFVTWLRTGFVYDAPTPLADEGLKFNPNHDPADGRFTTGGGGGATKPVVNAMVNALGDVFDAVNPIGAAEAAPARAPTGIVDLTEHETAGGHAIREHVGRSDAALKRQLDIPVFSIRTPFGQEDVYPSDYGTFLSLGSANRLISATLAAHVAEVAAVASG